MSSISSDGHFDREGYRDLALSETISLSGDYESLTFTEPSQLTLRAITEGEGKISFSCRKVDGTEKIFSFYIGEETPLFQQVKGLSSDVLAIQKVQIKALVLKYILTALKVHEVDAPSKGDISINYLEDGSVSVKSGGNASRRCFSSRSSLPFRKLTPRRGALVSNNNPCSDYA